MDAKTTQLVQDLGPEVLATLGGAPSSKLEQMKAKLQKRPPRKSRLAVFAALDDATTPQIRSDIEKGRVVGYQTGELSVAITGLEQWLRVAAHDMPLLYGLFGVFIAGLMGWGVATLFRRV